MVPRQWPIHLTQITARNCARSLMTTCTAAPRQAGQWIQRRSRPAPSSPTPQTRHSQRARPLTSLSGKQKRSQPVDEEAKGRRARVTWPPPFEAARVFSGDARAPWPDPPRAGDELRRPPPRLWPAIPGQRNEGRDMLKICVLEFMYVLACALTCG